jgi:hypothetical protein
MHLFSTTFLFLKKKNIPFQIEEDLGLEGVLRKVRSLLKYLPWRATNPKQGLIGNQFPTQPSKERIIVEFHQFKA